MHYVGGPESQLPGHRLTRGRQPVPLSDRGYGRESSRNEMKGTIMAKKTTPAAVAYSIGDRVIATTAATKQEPASGTITDISKTGWFIVTLDDAERFSGCKDGKLSARISSLQAETPAPRAKPGSLMGQLQSANDKTPKPEKPAKAPKAAPVAPKLPTACPECESSDLIMETDEDGNTTVSCSCGWEETYPADPETACKMAEALKKAREHYTKDKRPDGAATAHCGDAIAKELRDLEPMEVAALADRVLQQPAGTHEAKYERLNNGQIRMNSGNRIRSYWKKINEEGQIQEVARVGKLLNLLDDEAESDAE